MKQKMKKVFAKALAGLLIVSNLSIAVPGTIHAASAASFATVGGAVYTDQTEHTARRFSA